MGRPKVHAGLERRNWGLQDGRVGRHLLYACFSLYSLIINQCTQLQYLDVASLGFIDFIFQTHIEDMCKVQNNQAFDSSAPKQITKYSGVFAQI